MKSKNRGILYAAGVIIGTSVSVSACGGGAAATEETVMVMTDASRGVVTTSSPVEYPLDFGGAVDTKATTTLLSVYAQKKLESIGITVHSKRAVRKKRFCQCNVDWCTAMVGDPGSEQVVSGGGEGATWVLRVRPGEYHWRPDGV